MVKYVELREQILESVIGTRDPVELSRRLGYSFNQVERWRRGIKQCRWGEFWDLCEITGTPLPKILHELLAFPYSDEPADFMRHLRSLHLAQSIETLAPQVNVHPATLKRYFRGDTSADLETVLRIIQLTPQALETFLARLGVQPSHFTNPDSALSRVSEREWMGLEPVLAALLAALELTGYLENSHSPEFLGREVGITATEVDALLDPLRIAGIVQWNGRVYHKSAEFLQFEGASRQAAIRFAQFWTRRSYVRLVGNDGEPVTKGPLPNYFGFRIAALSSEGERRVAEALRRCHQEIIAIEANDESPKNEVRVILLHDFSSRDVPNFDLTKMIREDLKPAETVT